MTDDRPLILFVAPYFAPAYHGGVVQIYLSLLARLRRYRVVVVADCSNTTADEAAAWDSLARLRFGFEVERIEAFEFHLTDQKAGPVSRLLRLARFLRQGRRQWRALCRKHAPDVIVCGGTYSAGWLMTNSPARSALVNYIHGEELTMQVKPRLLMPWMRYWQRRCLKKADMNLSVSNYTTEMVSEVTKFSERSKVFPNFIDLKRFQISGKRRELRAKYGWSENLVLLTVARLERRKGIDQVFRALALLKQQGKLQDSWKYVIGGKGAEQNALIQLTEELGLVERVEFLGFVPDESLTGLYESADVFIQPNREINGDTEGFGIVFLEANACGLPVIGGRAGGTGDAIEHGRTGFRVDSESVDEVADAIFLLMGNAELRRKISLQGIAWAANFDVEQAVLRFDSLMEEALQLHSLGGTSSRQ